VFTEVVGERQRRAGDHDGGDLAADGATEIGDDHFVVAAIGGLRVRDDERRIDRSGNDRPVEPPLIDRDGWPSTTTLKVTVLPV